MIIRVFWSTSRLVVIAVLMFSTGLDLYAAKTEFRPFPHYALAGLFFVSGAILLYRIFKMIEISRT